MSIWTWLMPSTRSPRRDNAADPSGEERRRYFRFGCRPITPCQLFVAPDGDVLEGAVEALSLQGATLVVRGRVANGQRLVVEWEQGKGTVQIMADVLYARILKTGHCRLGCTFPTPLPVSVLMALVERLGGPRQPAMSQPEPPDVPEQAKANPAKCTLPAAVPG